MTLRNPDLGVRKSMNIGILNNIRDTGDNPDACGIGRNKSKAT